MVVYLYSLDFCKDLAIKKGGICLADRYINADTKMLWRCSRGHEFHLTLYEVNKRACWCKDCPKEDLLQLCQKKAGENGGECLSKVFTHIFKSKLKWRCAQGHEWEASWFSVRNGSWCQKCRAKSSAPAKKKGMSQSERFKRFREQGFAACQAHAKSLNGKFLSERYLSSNHKHLWECAKGHQWEAKWGNVRHGKWCPECAGRRQTIADLKAHAKAKNGECLSNNYTRQDAHYIWKCAEGHEWKTSWLSVKGGSWCPRCSNSYAYLTEEERQQKYQIVAQEVQKRGGVVIAKRYLGGGMEFECADGHRFVIRPDQMLKGKWCKQCGGHHAEKLVRIAFETIFGGYKFPNVRPEFLRSSSGTKLELDGYCSDLRLAFEHDGIQHFKTRSQFSGGKRGLRQIQKRDAEKDELCKLNNITLIRIAYDENFDELPQIIKDKIPANRSDLLSFDFGVKPDYSTAYKPTDPLEVFRKIAKQKGGKVLSTTLPHGDAYIELECSAGHRWKAIAETVKNRGHWCRKCGYFNKKQAQSSITWDDVQEIRRMADSGEYVLSELIKKLSVKYGVHPESMRRIINRRTRLYS